MARVALITGVSRTLGSQLAAALESVPSIERIIGVDSVPPDPPLDATRRTEFVRADIASARIEEIINAEKVDTVAHLGLIATPGEAGGRAAMKDGNVIGAMRLFAACQRSLTVGRLIVRSSAAVYGSSPTDPSMFTEDVDITSASRSGYAKDVVEVEGYLRGLARRRPEIAVTVLRFAHVLGPHVDSPLARYLRLPVVPTPAGYDPRLQFVHTEDATNVLVRTVLEHHPGTFNVAGRGVMWLSQALRRAGRPAVPMDPLTLRLLGGVARRTGLISFTADQLELLRHGRAIDASRLSAELGASPAYTTLQTFDDFAAAAGLSAECATDLVDEIRRATLGAQ